MRICIVSTTMLLLFGVTCRAEQKLELSPEGQEKFGRAAMRLAFADGCDRRLDMPELFLAAKEAFRQIALELQVPDADAMSEKVADELSNKPSQPEVSGFTLFNPKLCGDLARALEAEKDE